MNFETLNKLNNEYKFTKGNFGTYFRELDFIYNEHKNIIEINNNFTKPRTQFWLKKLQCIELSKKHNSNIMLCECDFDSQIAYIVEKINDEPIKTTTIIDYLNDKNLQSKVNNNELFLVCVKGNELIKYQSNIKKCHFKHKNVGDNPMSEWHRDWQECFDITEEPIGNRRADAMVGNKILEFQHSRITKEEINSRTNNYKDYEVFWIIDCRNAIEVDNKGNTYLIKFETDYWKYKNFESLKYIYLDNGNRIFRIKPSDVKSNMIEVADYKIKNEFIAYLKNETIKWEDNFIEQGIIYYNQRGAGCGKTYESIQLLQSNQFKDKETFIYLTKMNSAKDVINYELKEQIKDNKLNSLEFGENHNYKDDRGRQFKLNFWIKEDDDIEKEIIIGTMDSFTYAIGLKKHSYSDFFSGIVKSIRDGYASISKNGNIRYAQRNITLNQKCLIIIDEAQDLGPEYIEAFDIIINKTGIDVYIIGDELQSIWSDNNIYTFVKNNPLKTKVIFNEGLNRVRRFHNIHFQDFVNGLIDFEHYNLPKIEGICDTQCKYKHENNKNPYEIFEIPEIYSNESDTGKVDTVIEKIIHRVNKEVDEYNYLPKNFMFIFSFIKKNYLASQLETRLQDYWVKKFKNDEYQKNVLLKNDYWKRKINGNKFSTYVYLHKSEDGQPINFKESENASRMLSIHSSKGSGCEVVFLLGISEYTLMRYSKEKCNLVYDSLLHVAITRQKKSLYVGLVKNGDEIWNRFDDKFEINKDKNIKPRIENIRIFTRDTDIMNYILNNDGAFKKINDVIIKPNKCDKKLICNPNSKEIIDWGHHIIRYCVFFYNIMKNIVEKETMEEEDSFKSQFITILKKVSVLKVCSYSYSEYYKKLNDLSRSKEDNIEIPILLFEKTKNSVYKKYCDILKEFIIDIQKKLISNLKKKKLPSLCPVETLVLLYMIHINDEGKYSERTIMEIYTIMCQYDECSKELINHPSECLCKTKFIEGNNNSNADSYQSIRNSIRHHYEKVELVDIMYNNYREYITKKFKKEKFTYNVNHSVRFSDTIINFNICGKYTILAYSKKYVIHFIIKPDFNKVNFNEVMTDAIFTNFFLSNCTDDKKRYHNKKIITCIFSLNSAQPIFYELNIDQIRCNMNKFIKQFLIDKHRNYHSLLYEYYEYCLDNKPDNKSSIEHMCDELDKNQSGKTIQLPMYMIEYFHAVNKEISKTKNPKEFIKNKLGEKDSYMEEINYDLIIAIDKYLGINIDGDNKIDY